MADGENECRRRLGVKLEDKAMSGRFLRMPAGSVATDSTREGGRSGAEAHTRSDS